MKELKQFNDCLARIKQGEHKSDDLMHSSKVVFSTQLGFSDFPIKDFDHTFFKQLFARREAINNGLGQAIEELKGIAKRGDVQANVLLGQFYYDAPIEQLAAYEGLFQDGDVARPPWWPDFAGFAETDYNVLSQSKKNGAYEKAHDEALKYFQSAWQQHNSVLAMYYIAKLWMEVSPVELVWEQGNKRITISDLKSDFERLWDNGELTKKKCDLSHKDVLLIKSTIMQACLMKENRAKSLANKALKLEKENTEDLMQWIAHSTNSDLTSLELAVEREHAVNSQVLTQKVRQDVETFSLMSSDSDVFIDAVKRDITGTTTLNDVIFESIISTMLFMLSPKARDQKLMNHRYFDYAQNNLDVSSEVKRKDWIKSSAFPTMQKALFTQFLALKEDYSASLSWIAVHFGEVLIDIDEGVCIQMSDHGKKAAVLSYIMKQFINNAMKYGVADYKASMLSIKCGSNGENYILTCSNMDMQSRIRKGSNKGLQAMDLMLSKLNQPSLEIKQEQGTFEVTCRLSKALMGG